MPRLLSHEEATEIASKMTEEYGLPPPLIVESNPYNTSSYSWYVKVHIRRLVPVRVFSFLPFLKKLKPISAYDFSASSLEDALSKLQYELARFDSRVEIADKFRDRYATTLLNEELKKP